MQQLHSTAQAITNLGDMRRIFLQTFEMSAQNFV